MNECNIVRDLLPLYADDLASLDSVEFIERHTENCPRCQEIWRRYKGELPVTHPPVPEPKDENMLAPLHREVMKFICKFIGNALLLIILAGVLLVYLGWEKGYFPLEAEYSAPSAQRSVELIDLGEAGFFSNEEGTLIQFRFGMGNLFRYRTAWENVKAHWAQDNNTVLLTMETLEGMMEIRLVDLETMLAEGGGTFEIPGLFPSEAEPDLTQVLKELCAEQGVTVSGFEFAEWSDDSLHLWFRCQTADGPALLEFDLETKTVQFHVVQTIDIPVTPVDQGE